MYALLDKAPSIARLIEHPVLLELLDQLLPKNYLLSDALAINVHPGETPQPLHRDDTSKEDNFGHMETLTGVSVMWAIDDFTEKNGATELSRRAMLTAMQQQFPRDYLPECLLGQLSYLMDDFGIEVPTRLPPLDWG